MIAQPLTVAVLIGSVRHGRFGVTVADWFVEQAKQRDDVIVDLIDVADYEHARDMAFDPRLAGFGQRLHAADAFVVVTPEYNHSYPGPLKTAIDSVQKEWHAKPVAFVSYGGRSGGLRAVEALRIVFSELHATTIRDVVSFHGGSAVFDDRGSPLDATASAAASKMLEQLTWWAHALRSARDEKPYIA